MFTLAFLLAIGLIGWTASAFLSKGKHQDEIKEELQNMFNSFKSFFSSLKNLVYLLIKDSIKSAADGDLEMVKDNVLELVKDNVVQRLKNEETKKSEDKAA